MGHPAPGEGWGTPANADPAYLLCQYWSIQTCPNPPSTLISTPVMYDASCEAKKAHGACYFFGLPKSLQWHLGNDVLREVIDGFFWQTASPEDWRNDRPRSNGVHANAAL